MTDIAEAFATAQEAALRGSVALRTAMGLATVRLYEVVPTDAPLPYVHIGEDQIIDDSDECQDGSEINATVHLWSKPNPPSTSQARNMVAAVRAALKNLTITGHDVVLAEFRDALLLTDPSGATHVVVNHRYLTVPTD